MSFLSFYNDHHGKGTEEIISLINEENWEQLDFVSRTDPLSIHWKVTIPNFYPKVDSKVLPIHSLCQKKPPLQAVKTLNEIFPRGLLTEESAYHRLPLHIACMYQAAPETVLYLIQSKPAACKRKDALGRLPLHYACKDQTDEVILKLLQVYPGSTKQADKQGFLPLHVACRSDKSVYVIRQLLRQNPKLANQTTQKGSTPYMFAKKHMTSPHKDEVLELLRICERGAAAPESSSTATDETSVHAE